MPRQIPKNGYVALSRKANRLDLAFDAPLAKPARDQDAVVAGQQSFRAFPLNRLAQHASDAHLRPIVNAGVIERLVDRLVGVEVRRILADHGDADFMFRIAQAVQQIAPVLQVELPGRQAAVA